MVNIKALKRYENLLKVSNEIRKYVKNTIDINLINDIEQVNAIETAIK